MFPVMIHTNIIHKVILHTVMNVHDPYSYTHYRQTVIFHTFILVYFIGYYLFIFLNLINSFILPSLSYFSILSFSLSRSFCSLCFSFPCIILHRFHQLCVAFFIMFLKSFSLSISPSFSFSPPSPFLSLFLFCPDH